MPRYIDADRITLPQGFFEKVDNVPKFNEWLSTIPSADVRENVHGQWILIADENHEYCICSNCGYDNGENWMIGSEIPYCAQCGADMKEGSENE